MSDKIEKAKSEVEAEQVVTGVVRSETADIAFRTVARAKARLEAYNRIAENYTKFIDSQAEKLQSGLFSSSPYKELGVARLISVWIAESEVFLKEMEPLLQDTERQMRQGFMEQSFNRLPKEVSDRIMTWFNDAKADLIVRLVGMVQEELRKLDES